VSTLEVAASRLQTAEPWLPLDFCISGWILSASYLLVLKLLSSGILRSVAGFSLPKISRTYIGLFFMRQWSSTCPLTFEDETSTLSRNFGQRHPGTECSIPEAPLRKPENSLSCFTWNWPPYQLVLYILSEYPVAANSTLVWQNP
jgi:hypothetical protein